MKEPNPADLPMASDDKVTRWIASYERKNAQDHEFYRHLLEERAKRQQSKQQLNVEKSLNHLKLAAVKQGATSYGELAGASGVKWSIARHQMNGAHGHLDRLIDICFARNLPQFTAICVNQNGLLTCELEPTALKGFISGLRRVGISVVNELEYHHQCREQCWAWGRSPAGIAFVNSIH